MSCDVRRRICPVRRCTSVRNGFTENGSAVGNWPRNSFMNIHFSEMERSWSARATHSSATTACRFGMSVVGGIMCKNLKNCAQHFRRLCSHIVQIMLELCTNYVCHLPGYLTYLLYCWSVKTKIIFKLTKVYISDHYQQSHVTRD